MANTEAGVSVKSSLNKRIGTALVLVPLVVAAVLFLPTVLFALMLTVVTGLGAWEWSGLAKLPSRFMQQLFTALVVFFLAIVWFVLQWQAGLMVLLLIALAWWSVAATWVIRFPDSASIWSTSVWWRVIIGILVLVPAWAGLVALHGHGEQGPWLILLLMLLIWGADSGAYFTGRKWGKDKLVPQVSPGKSWQGLYGGVVTAVLMMLLLIQLLPVQINYQLFFIAICIITIMFSVLGDLVESMFKRSAGVKDSGNLLPGHGGVLDRIDSLTAAAPIFALGILGTGL